jgi:hypothetical protein
MSNKPSWKKGDIIALLGYNRKGVVCIFEAEHDPRYYSKDWYYGFVNCEEIRPATIDDIDHKIRFQKEIVEREQLRLDRLLNFRERLEKR